MKKTLIAALILLAGISFGATTVNNLVRTNEVITADGSDWTTVAGAATGMVVNVKLPPYNAVGDGVTDDTAAIQAALNYATSNDTVEVSFPPGTYMISDELIVNFVTANNGLIISGAGPGRSEIYQSGATNALTVYGSGLDESITVRDLQFTGRIDPSTPATYTNSGDGITIYGDVDKSFKVVCLDNVMVRYFNKSLRLINTTAVTAFNYSCYRNLLGAELTSLSGAAYATYATSFIGGMFHGNLVDVVGEDCRGLLFRGVDMCTQVCTNSMIFRRARSTVSIEGCLFEPPAVCTNVIVSEVAGNSITLKNNYIMGEIGTDQYVYASLSSTSAGLRDYATFENNILLNMDGGGYAYLEGYDPQVTGSGLKRKDLAIEPSVKRNLGTVVLESSLSRAQSYRNSETTQLDASNRGFDFWEYQAGATTLVDDQWKSVYLAAQGGGTYLESPILNNQLCMLTGADTTSHTNTTTGAWQTLYTTTLPARYIYQSGSQLRFTVSGTFASNSNLKGVQLFTGNKTFSSMTSTNHAGDFVFQGAMTITDIGANLARSQATLVSNGDSQASVVTGVTWSESSSQAFAFKAWGDAASDVIIKDVRVDYFNPVTGL